MRMYKRQKQNRWTVRLCVVAACAVAAWATNQHGLSAQSLSYTSGQPVSPAFEGWEADADGTRYFLFGYMNKNWEEELDVPVGPANGFSPGDTDRGQPTHFLPRRNRFVFRVRVPQGFTDKDELVWTLTTHGRTTRAYASLRADYLIDDIVKASETGALGPGTSSPTVRSNKPPTVRIDGPRNRTAKVGEPVALVAILIDDGIPKARSRDELIALLARRAQALSPFGAPASPSTASPSAAAGADSAPASPLAASWRPGCSPRRRTESPSERTWAYTFRGSSIAGPVRSTSSRLKSNRGKTRGQEPTRRGRRSGSHRRCRPMA